MSVFTRVSHEQLAEWLKGYSIGHLLELKGILAGIENTNYFVTTSHGRYVLTLFEKLQPAELPFYLELMAHLSSHGLPCPKPIADLDNAFLGHLNGKPAALVTCLAGAPVMAPGAAHCARVGEVLADLHLAGRSYRGRLDNLRGPKWWSATAPDLLPFLADANKALLTEEVRFQSSHRLDELPRGVVHADLFRDNVLFDGEAIGGVIDFYFACVDVLLYDVAITVNDWCTTEDCELDPERTRALLDAYRATRDFTEAERAAWPVMLRAGALRFWVSRLYDFHLPRPGDLTHAHDPVRFERILRHHVNAAARPGRLLRLVA
jgi:homoserine kinase type II